MSQVIHRTLLLLALVTAALGFNFDLSTSEDDQEYDEPESQAEARFIFLPSTANGLNLNVTILAALIASLASSLMSLFSLVGLGLLAASKIHDHPMTYHDSGHSSYRRFYDNFSFDWEALSISDWISLFQETWNTFDPSDIECQKRFICELHQNSKKLGPTAEMLNYLLSFLQYGEVLSLPEAVKEQIEEYLDAADRGKSLQRDCGDLFSDCKFSVTKIITKYHPEKESTNYI